MSEQLRCRLCERTMLVSEEDPDSTLSDMLDHVDMRHRGAPSPDVIVAEPCDLEDS